MSSSSTITSSTMSLVYLPQESTSEQNDSIWSIAWTPSGLLSGGADGVLRVHDPADLTLPTNELPSLPLAISSLSATADGKYALAMALDGTAGLADVAGGKYISKVDTGKEAVGDGTVPGYASGIHPSGSAWAWAGRGSKLAIRRIEGPESDAALSGSGNLVDVSKGRFGLSVQFSPDGAQVAVGFESGHVAVADVESGSVVATYSAHAMGVRALTWSPDSQWLYSGADDARVVLHDVRGGASREGAVAVLQGHRGWVLDAAASPDAKLLATGSADSTVKLWDIGQRACVGTNNADAEVWAVAWQPEYEGSLPPGKQFAIAGDDKKVSLFRAAGAV